MIDETVHEGGCLCGFVRYRFTGQIDSVAHCHCGMCRRSSGSLVVTWATISEDHFAYVDGKPMIHQSSAHAERHFCPRCGSQIAFRSERSPGCIDITLGTFDHPETHPADCHIWTSGRVSWLHLDEHLPGFPEDMPSGYRP